MDIDLIPNTNNMLLANNKNISNTIQHLHKNNALLKRIQLIKNDVKLLRKMKKKQFKKFMNALNEYIQY